MSRPRDHPAQFAPAAAAKRWAARLAEAPPAGALPEGSAQRQHGASPRRPGGQIPQMPIFWSAASSRQNVTASPTFPIPCMRYSASSISGVQPSPVQRSPYGSPSISDQPGLIFSQRSPFCSRICRISFRLLPSWLMAEWGPKDRHISAVCPNECAYNCQEYAFHFRS
jgi:hypothetical protein